MEPIIVVRLAVGGEVSAANVAGFLLIAIAHFGLDAGKVAVIG